ncbi:MAG: DUF3592 domain-containing protein [Kineosporiaceae bacterium]
MASSTTATGPVAPMPRPSRGARWGIGLALTGLLLLAGSTAGAVALGQAVGGAQECIVPSFDSPFGCSDDDLTQEASARVLRLKGFGGGSAPDAGRAGRTNDVLLDLEFEASERTVRAYDVYWGLGAPPVQEGDTVTVAYDPSDPEFLVASQDELAAKRAREAAHPDEGASPAALWSTGGLFLAAVVALAGTVVWARRAPQPVRPAPAGWYGVPGYGYGYGYASGYPQPVYGPPGYPQPVYGSPGYPQQPVYGPAGYPQQPVYAPAGYPPPVQADPSPQVPQAPPPRPPAGWNAPG